MTQRVVSARCWVMREPSRSSAKETELLFGHPFHIEETQKKWVFGHAFSPLDQKISGYQGWVRREDLSQTDLPRTHYVSALKAPVFKASDIKSRVMRLLPQGAQINAARIGGSFIELASGGFMHCNHLRALGDYAQTDFVTAAEVYMGLPYIWGGVSSYGLDCSGLVQSALRAIGQDCLRDASQQEKSLGAPVAADGHLQRGDLVFWPGHVGIMTDTATLLHANAFHMEVATEPLSEAINRIGQPRQINRL